MAPGILIETWLVIVGGVLALARPLGVRPALLVVLVRVLLVVCYFGLVGDGGLRMTDDQSYSAFGREMAALGIGPIELISTPQHFARLLEAGGGPHIGYFWLNALAMSLFGPHYWAPVLLNVLFSLLAARAVHSILTSVTPSAAWARHATLFFLFQWDVIAWSSFLNLKDTAVMALTAYLFAGIVEFLRRPALRPFATAAAATLLLGFLRFYTPILALGTVACWVLLNARGWRRLVLVALASGAIALLMPRVIPLERLAPVNVAFGALRFTLTPLPWSISPTHAFLLGPSLLHWAAAPFAVLGGFTLWRRSRLARVLILYVAASILFYALVPDLQGPRHRYQLVFALALMQFQGLYGVTAAVLGRPRRLAGAALEAV